MIVGSDNISAIDGGRYEVYVPSPGGVDPRPEVQTYQKLASKTLKAAVNRYLVWSEESARTRLLPHIRDAGELASGYQFGSHSFLISFDENTRAQVGHMDVKGGCGLVQIAAYLTEGTYPTMVDSTRLRVTPSVACKNLGLSRKEGVRLQSLCGETLNAYGDMSLSKVDIDKRLRKAAKQSKPVPAGSMSACLGGILHAGPASNGQRVVLFFVGRPANSQWNAWNSPHRGARL